MELSQVFLDHSMLMFNNLPKQKSSVSFRGSNNKQMFYEELPDTFKRSDAVELGKRYSLSERTVDAFLKSLVGNFLQQESFGMYSKTEINRKSLIN